MRRECIDGKFADPKGTLEEQVRHWRHEAEEAKERLMGKTLENQRLRDRIAQLDPGSRTASRATLSQVF